MALINTKGGVNKLNGRKVFEYVSAGIITGIAAPLIYKEYKNLFNDKIKKVNLNIGDAIAMYNGDDEDEDDY